MLQVNEDDHIKIERSKALHELVDAHAQEHVIIANHPSAGGGTTSDVSL